MVMAGVDGHSGEPGSYRDYQLKQIMFEQRGEAATGGVVTPVNRLSDERVDYQRSVG